MSVWVAEDGYVGNVCECVGSRRWVMYACGDTVNVSNSTCRYVCV